MVNEKWQSDCWFALKKESVSVFRDEVTMTWT